MSKGFLSALFGIAMTLLGWYGPWEWPSWPGIIAVDAISPTGALSAEAPFMLRATIVVLLIALNVGVWAVVARAALYTIARCVSLRSRIARPNDIRS